MTLADVDAAKNLAIVCDDDDDDVMMVVVVAAAVAENDGKEVHFDTMAVAVGHPSFDVGEALVVDGVDLA